MQIAVISDTHLGRGDDADHFGHDDAEFLKFLSFLEANFERIVLLGDIYETLTGPSCFSSRAAEFHACRQAHREIAQRIEGDQYRYVLGNHDEVAGHVSGAPDELTLNVDGKRYLFTHGHQYDWAMGKLKALAEAGIWIGGWLMRLGLEPLYRGFERLDAVGRGARLNPEGCGFQQWAVAYAAQRSADAIITGHTHLGVCSEHQDRMFMNSGSCSNGHYSFLSLDTRLDRYALNTGW